MNKKVVLKWLLYMLIVFCVSFTITTIGYDIYNYIKLNNLEFATILNESNPHIMNASGCLKQEYGYMRNVSTISVMIALILSTCISIINYKTKEKPKK